MAAASQTRAKSRSKRKLATASSRIGTRHESSLHASLKKRYAQRGDAIEAVVDGYQIDVVHRAIVRESKAQYIAGDRSVPQDDLLIEIQTRSFSSLKRKLRALLESHRVRIVHPIACEKWIVRIEPTGVIVSRRRSPKRGCIEHLFDELVSFPDLMTHPNLSLEVVLTREEEIRCDDGRGSWRRGGWSIRDRRLIEVVETMTFAEPSDFLKLLPAGLPAPFTSRELAKAMGRSVPFAQRVAYCLRKMGAIEVIGKRRRAWVYALCKGE
jgi:hypothetical protein